MFEAIALFLGTDNGNVLTLFKNSFGGNIGCIFYLLVVLALFVSLNGLSLSYGIFINLCSEDELIFVNNKYVSIKKSSIIQMIIGLLWFVVLLSLGLASKQITEEKVFDPTYYVNIFSTIVVVCGFVLYTILIFFSVINHFTEKIKVKYSSLISL